MIYHVYDFDDTLARTDAKIVVVGKDGKRRELSSAEYATFKPQPGDKMDMSQFDDYLVRPRARKKYMSLLKKSHGNSKIKTIILTARAKVKPIAKFLKKFGITSGITMVGVGTSNPQAKKSYIEKLIKKGAREIIFYDDAQKNISAVNSLRKQYPQVNLKTVLV